MEKNDVIDRLYDTSAGLELIAYAAGDIASGEAESPLKLANAIKQVACSLVARIGEHIELLEVDENADRSMRVVSS